MVSAGTAIASRGHRAATSLCLSASGKLDLAQQLGVAMHWPVPHYRKTPTNVKIEKTSETGGFRFAAVWRWLDDVRCDTKDLR